MQLEQYTTVFPLLLTVLIVFSDIPFFNAKASNDISHSLKFLGDFAERDEFNTNKPETTIKLTIFKKIFIIFFFLYHNMNVLTILIMF